MASTTAAARLDRIRLALIGKLMVIGWTEALTREDGQSAPDTYQALSRLGATMAHRDAAWRAIGECAYSYRPQPGIGPLMQRAVEAWRQGKARWEREAADKASPVVVDLSDTDDAAGFPSDGGPPGAYVVDLDDTEARTVETEPAPREPAPAPRETEPMVAPRGIHVGIW